MDYRREIDGLRAIAVLPVILFHAGWDVFSGGYVGVDVFFVISGYLITTIILTEQDGGNFSLVGFYERRARRILPALYFVVQCCLPFAWLWMTPGELAVMSRAVVAVTLFSSNILFWLESGYFAPAAELMPLLHTWSLAVEEQYYMLFPVLILLGWRFGKPLLALTLLALALISLGLSQWASGNHPSANFYLLPTRLWELLLGSLTAFYLLKKHTVQPATKLTEAFALLGLLLILYAVFRFDSNTPFPSLYALVPTLGTALVILFAKPGMLVTRLLTNKLLVGIGLLSYSAYLWHQPLFAFARLRSPQEPDLAVMSALGLAVFPLAYLSWRCVETPFRDRKRFSRRKIFTLALGVSLLLLAIGLAGVTNHGFAQRVATNGKTLAELDLDARLVINTGLGEHCDNPVTRPASCQTAEHPEILVWGDSYVMHLVDGILASNPEVRIIQLAKNNCGPILGLAPTNSRYTQAWAQRCLSFNQAVAQWLSQPDTPRYVMLSSAFYQYLANGWKLYTGHKPEPLDREMLYQYFEATLDFLVQNGIRPIVFSPPPNTGSNIGHCLARAALHGDGLEQCDIALDQRNEATLLSRELLTRIDKDYDVVWLDDFICDDSRCRVQIDGVFLYRDHGHLSREGAAYLGKQMDFYGLITGKGSQE